MIFNTKQTVIKSRGIIAERVMSVIEARINAGQKNYDEACDQIDRESFQKKVDAADRIVEEITR